MSKSVRWFLGLLMLGSFMLLAITIIAYSFVEIEKHDYQWHITAPVMAVLLVGGGLILPIKGEKDK